MPTASKTKETKEARISPVQGSSFEDPTFEPLSSPPISPLSPISPSEEDDESAADFLRISEDIPIQIQKPATEPAPVRASVSVSHSVNSSYNLEPPVEVRKKTKGGGDCAFHAIFGEWHAESAQYECKDVAEKRKSVAQAIRDTLRGNHSIISYVNEAIQALVMSGMVIPGEKIKDVSLLYQHYLTESEPKIAKAWANFEGMLTQYPEILAYISSEMKASADTLKNKFHACLNKNNGALYGLIYSITELQDAFEQYNQEAHGDFNWHDKLNAKEVINEYADFIEQPRGWLLPCEIGIIAHTFKTGIRFYTVNPQDKTQHLVTTFNDRNLKMVSICFNGLDHYEKMTVATALPLSRVPPVVQSKEQKAPENSQARREQQKQEEQKQEEQKQKEPIQHTESAAPKEQKADSKSEGAATDAPRQAIIENASSQRLAKAGYQPVLTLSEQKWQASYFPLAVKAVQEGNGAWLRVLLGPRLVKPHFNYREAILLHDEWRKASLQRNVCCMLKQVIELYARQLNDKKLIHTYQDRVIASKRQEIQDLIQAKEDAIQGEISARATEIASYEQLIEQLRQHNTDSAIDNLPKYQEHIVRLGEIIEQLEADARQVLYFVEKENPAYGDALKKIKPRLIS